MPRKLLYLLIFLLVVTVTFAQLPENLLKAQEYNTQVAKDAVKNISFIIAFLAGMLSILSPCTYAILPAFFSYTFKEKKEITKMTLLFFLGSATDFVFLGLLAAALGETLASIQFNYPFIPTIGGLFLIFFGLMTLCGKSFSSFFHQPLTKTDPAGLFLFGMFFVLGWTACLGPILASILLIAALLQNYLYAAVLLFFYALGTFVPLFLLSIFYDKFELHKKQWMRGNTLAFSLFGKEYTLHTTNIISGGLIILFGIIIIIFRGTTIINNWDFLRTKEYFYSFQRMLAGNTFLQVTGAILLIIFIYHIYQTIKK